MAILLSCIPRSLQTGCNMSRSLGNTIADSLSLSLTYGKRMLTGVTPLIFARFARPGGHSVESNHAAFVYGHLSLYAARVVEQLGGDASAIQPAPAFVAAFSKDAQCQDDPDGTIYPPMDEVTDAFFKNYEAAMAALRVAPDEPLQQANPAGGRMTELFPTIGSMQAFYVGGHMMFHWVRSVPGAGCKVWDRRSGQ